MSWMAESANVIPLPPAMNTAAEKVEKTVCWGPPAPKKKNYTKTQMEEKRELEP